MEETGTELEQLLDDEYLNQVPLLIFANKQDLMNASSAEKISEHMNLSCIRNRIWNIQPCSAKTGEGLEDGIEWVMEHVRD